jgi:hypothetical protein
MIKYSSFSSNRLEKVLRAVEERGKYNWELVQILEQHEPPPSYAFGYNNPSPLCSTTTYRAILIKRDQ